MSAIERGALYFLGLMKVHTQTYRKRSLQFPWLWCIRLLHGSMAAEERGVAFDKISRKNLCPDALYADIKRL